MDLEVIRRYCLEKRGSTETYPYGPDVAVFNVGPKMFALAKTGEQYLRINLKCEPELAVIFRQQYQAVTPGYYMNKQHWNTVELDGSIPEEEVLKMIDMSYELVFRGLKKVEKDLMDFYTVV